MEKIHPYIYLGIKSPEQKTKSDLTTLLHETCKVFNISEVEIQSSSRKEPYVLARKAFCRIAYDMKKYPLSKIGEMLKRHHATVLFSITTSQNLIDTNYEFFTIPYNKIRINIQS